MQHMEQWLGQAMQEAGWLGPVFYVLLHLLRPFFILPVVIVCAVGGYVFGFVWGTVYSLIGLSLMCALFYQLVRFLPWLEKRMLQLKRKTAGNKKMTIGQVMILRVMPFVHFHLLSFYLIDMTSSYREYMKFSILGVAAPAVLYTAFGEALATMPWFGSLALLVGLVFLFWLIDWRNKNQSSSNKKTN